MKKLVLIIGSFAFFQYFARAQDSVQLQPERKLKKTEIDFVYNHYIQDGENSAVTGGIGTEALTVYGPSLAVKRSAGRKQISAKFGADIISSASTDNIDFVKSSASILDARFYANGEYAHNIEHNNMTVYAGGGLSLESDYLSIGAKAGFDIQSKLKLSTYSLGIQYFNDDLRWGRITKGVTEYELVYPAELRSIDWYDEYKRISYNLKLGFSHIMNKRNLIGIYPELIYQNGLLATPFHRVFFTDNSIRVENLPDERIKIGMTLRWNTFVKGNMILKNSLGLYNDDFGIQSFSVANETAIKLSSIITLLPNVRFYAQSGSDYFAPYQSHERSAEFYTSDYDLSQMQTYKAGIGFRYSPQKFIRKNYQFNSFLFRYSFYKRSNQLQAHIISIGVRTTFHQKQIE